MYAQCTQKSLPRADTQTRPDQALQTVIKKPAPVSRRARKNTGIDRGGTSRAFFRFRPASFFDRGCSGHVKRFAMLLLTLVENTRCARVAAPIAPRREKETKIKQNKIKSFVDTVRVTHCHRYASSVAAACRRS